MTNGLSPASLIARSAAFARAMACPPPPLTGVGIVFGDLRS